MALRLGWWTIVAGLLLNWLLAACASPPLLSEVKAVPTAITPNGESRTGLATISYQLSQPASVSIYVVDEAGRKYPFRTDERRPAGSFEAPFAGAVKPSPDGETQRILPDGVYTYVVEATTAGGARAEAKGTLAIQGADAQPLEVADLVALPATITPNGDARDDKTVISYQLTKDAEVEIYATDANGQRYLIDPPTQRFAGLHGREWNGFSGGILAGNGDYQIHVVARDKSGNVAEGIIPVTLAEGGTPDLQILEVEFTPPTVPVGGEVQVKIRVKNTGNTPIHTKGPPPGTAFSTSTSGTTGTNYFAFTDHEGRPKYFDEAGRWRAAVNWNQSDRPYPARWALTQLTVGPDSQEEYPSILPGQESVSTGSIQVLIPQTDELHFWASYEKGAIGFGPQVGQRRIGISR